MILSSIILGINLIVTINAASLPIWNHVESPLSTSSLDRIRRGVGGSDYNHWFGGGWGGNIGLSLGGNAAIHGAGSGGDKDGTGSGSGTLSLGGNLNGGLTGGFNGGFGTFGGTRNYGHNPPPPALQTQHFGGFPWKWGGFGR